MGIRALRKVSARRSAFVWKPLLRRLFADTIGDSIINHDEDDDCLLVALDEVPKSQHGAVPMISRDDVLQQALALPPEDQAYVADMLEAQVSRSLSLSQELEQAWSSELELRLVAYQQGELGSLDAVESVNQLRQAVSLHRSSKAVQQ